MHTSNRLSDEKMKEDVSLKEDVEDGTVEDVNQHNVFVETEDGPDFRGVSVWGAAVLIAKSQFGLGVIGLPGTFQVLGMFPGLLTLVVLCALSTWTGVVVGKFRLSHPQVHSIGDATYLMFGKFGCELMGVAFWLFYTLCYGASLLTVSIGFNAMTDHAICTMGWVGMGAAVAMILGLSLRTMKALSWCGYVAVTTIFLGVWIVVIACLAQKVPAAAPAGEPVDKNVLAVPKGSSYFAISSAVATQLLSLCGTASFFTIHAEMRDQKKYVKSVLLGQGFVVFNYIAITVIIYAKVGQYVASPALGSAGPLFKNIGYGVAMPALFFSCFFQAHVAAKYALVRILRGTKHLQNNSLIHWGTWVSMMIVVIAVGFVIAGGIPFFDDLLGLIGAFLGTSFTLILPACMALYEMAKITTPEEHAGRPLVWLKESQKSWNKGKLNLFIAVVAWFTIFSGLYILVSGAFGSVRSIAENFASGDVGSAFSCADNSG